MYPCNANSIIVYLAKLCWIIMIKTNLDIIKSALKLNIHVDFC